MEAEQRRLIHPIEEQRLSERRNGTHREDRMRYFFGIAIIVFGITAMIILHVRSALPRDTSESVNDAKSFGDSTPQSIEDELRWLDRKLNLSPEQEAKVRPVVEAEIQQRIALLEAPSISTSEQQAQLVALRNHALEKIRPVLTEGQHAALDDLEQAEGGGAEPLVGD